MSDNCCFCGHDCSRCLVYLASIASDSAEASELRRQAKEFYKSEFGLDIPEDKLYCLGGRSDKVLYLCEDCPMRRCCLWQGIQSCRECVRDNGIPCRDFLEYTKKYVNKFNQKKKD